MNRQLPLLNIPNPLDEDNETPINFKYYQLNQLINLMNVNSQCFSILHTNIRCYNKNFPHLDTIIKKCSNSFDIIGLSETWDTHAEQIDSKSLDGYHPLERSPGVSQNSGVALYVKETLIFRRRNDLVSKLGNYIDYFESLFIEVEHSKSNYVIGVIYRHPNTRIHDFIDDIKDILTKIIKEKKRIILMGDFNIDLLKVQNNKESERFLDTMLDNYLLPYITQPTRFTQNLNSSLIDNIFLNAII